MGNQHKAAIREFVAEILRNRGDTGDLADDESLFIAGRLDSLSTLILVSHLEQTFGIDFAAFDFDVGLVDSIDAIDALVRERALR